MQLHQKVRRREKGQGEEVKLEKHEVQHLLKSGKYALISAGKNPELEKEISDEQVKARHEALRGDLKEAGYAWSQAQGNYGEAEDSFLVMVHDANRDEIKKLGKKYNQDSVIYGDHGKQEMMFTTGPKEGQVVSGEGYEEKPDAKEYYTQIGDMKFSLNFKFDEGEKPEGEKT